MQSLVWAFEIYVCRFTVAECLTHSPATLDVTGSRPNSGDFSEIYFLESIQSPAQRDLKMVCVTLQELIVTSNVCGDNW